MSVDDFDVIVVGAGPAGSCAAWKLAKAGKKVALLERGAYPGAKNLFGGMIYSLELAKHFPHFINEAPIERPITRHDTWFLAENGRSLNINFACEPYGEAPYNGFTAYRSRFDQWLANEAVAAGATLLPSCTVEKLCMDSCGAVYGVEIQREQGVLKAPLVICADGILSLLGKQAGLIKEQPAHCYSIGVREIIGLESGVIQDRFQIDGNGGCAALFVGKWPAKIQGGGFIYTNRETLSVGFVAQLDSLQRDGISIGEALDAFKQQPPVQKLIQGGERLEYGAHIVPEGGYQMCPPVVKDGLMLCGDAAALVLAAGVLYEGVHYAMHSGILAAEASLDAFQQGDFTTKTLGKYSKNLHQSYVMRNLKTFQHVPKLLGNPRMYQAYPELVCRVAEQFFAADEAGHRKLGQLLYQEMKKMIGLKAALSDLWKMIRAFF